MTRAIPNLGIKCTADSRAGSPEFIGALVRPWEKCKELPFTGYNVSTLVAPFRIRLGAVWNLDACIAHMAALAERQGSLMDELLDHVYHLRGSPRLDDDFSIIEAWFH